MHYPHTIQKVILTKRDGERIVYPNFLPLIQLSSLVIAEQSKAAGYKTLGNKVDDAEFEFPVNLSEIFYQILMEKQELPTTEEFFEKIILNFPDFENCSEEKQIGYKTRALSRTFPSLVRDVHFAKMSSELIAMDYDVCVSPTLDMDGIDVLLTSRKTNINYGICLFLNTPYAIHHLNRKRDKRLRFENTFYKEIALDRQQSDYLWLFSEEHVKRLVKEINENPLKDYPQTI